MVETSGAAYLRNRRYIKAASSRIKHEVANAVRRAKNIDSKTTEKMHKKVSFKKTVHFSI